MNGTSASRFNSTHLQSFLYKKSRPSRERQLYESSLLSDCLPYRAATTNYLCCDQALEDSKGAGRMGLTRISNILQSLNYRRDIS